MPGNEPREVKGEEKWCCWHYPNIPRNSGQSRTILCPDYFTESKIGYGFQQSDFLEVREKPRDGPDSYQEAPYFTWLILFAKEPNQSHLFCDSMITVSSVVPAGTTDTFIALITVLGLITYHFSLSCYPCPASGPGQWGRRRIQGTRLHVAPQVPRPQRLGPPLLSPLESCLL